MFHLDPARAKRNLLEIMAANQKKTTGQLGPGRVILIFCGRITALFCQRHYHLCDSANLLAPGRQ